MARDGLMSPVARDHVGHLLPTCVRQAIFKQQLYQCMLSQTLILKSDIETRSQILQQCIRGDFCCRSWMCVGRATQRTNPRLLGLGP